MEKYRHILATVDFSEISEHVLCRALEFADFYQARLSVLHVVEELPLGNEPFGEPPALILDSELQQQLEQSAQQQLKTLTEKLNYPELIDREVINGIPRHTITAWAQRHNVDLIVIGSHGHRGFFDLLGSTVDGVMHKAPCDVIVVRRRNHNTN